MKRIRCRTFVEQVTAYLDGAQTRCHASVRGAPRALPRLWTLPRPDTDNDPHAAYPVVNTDLDATSGPALVGSLQAR